MNFKSELLEVIKEYPSHEIVFLCPQDYDVEDYALVQPREIVIDKMTEDDAKVWMYSKEREELFESFVESAYYDLYSYTLDHTFEKEEAARSVAKEMFDELEWRDVVVIYLE